MKKLYPLLVIALTLCLTSALYAKSGFEKSVVKTELASLTPTVETPSVDDALSVGIFSFNYVAEDTQEIIKEFSPAVIGKINSGYVSKVYHPPVITKRDYLFAFGRRL